MYDVCTGGKTTSLASGKAGSEPDSKSEIGGVLTMLGSESLANSSFSPVDDIRATFFTYFSFHYSINWDPRQVLGNDIGRMDSLVEALEPGYRIKNPT